LAPDIRPNTSVTENNAANGSVTVSITGNRYRKTIAICAVSNPSCRTRISTPARARIDVRLASDSRKTTARSKEM
jgi:hypothetical protein